MKNKGITLVGLIITIIVLLILATVSISLIINNGVLDKAQHGVDKYSEEEELEQIKLAVASARLKGNGFLVMENLSNELEFNFENGKLHACNNFLICYGLYKNYIIMNTGEIIIRKKDDIVKGNLSKSRFKDLVSSNTPKNIIFTNTGGEGEDISE